MTLLELCSAYCTRVGGGQGYLNQLHIMAKRLPWQVSDLCPERIDAYLTEALRHLAPSTVHRHRRQLACLMRFAAAEGLLDGRIVLRPLRKVKVPRPNPRAWTHAEIGRLLAVVANMRGGTRHCPHRLLLPAWIRTAYCTGLRRSDLLALKHSDLRGGQACVTQEKTDWPHVVTFDQEALHAIAKLPKRGQRIFGDLVSGDRIVRVMGRAVKRAGLTGTTKFLRRSGATYCTIAGLDPQGYLGHRTPGMKAYYVDRLLVAQNGGSAQPPPLPRLEEFQGVG